MPDKTIIMTRDGNNNFRATLKDNPEIYGAGTNPQTALGSLMTSHKEIFGIVEIKYPRLKHFFVNLASRNAREKIRR